MSNLENFVNSRGGIDKVIFILPMLPIRQAGPLTYTSSSDGRVPVECKIEPKPDGDLDSLEGNYKVRLSPADPNLRACFGYERFYQSDLLSMVERGDFGIKIKA